MHADRSWAGWDRPLIGFFAPLLGPTGRAPDVFETLAPALVARGWPVVSSSPEPNPARRLADQVRVARAERRRLGAAFVHVYSGRSFVSADAVSAELRRAQVPLIGYLSGGGLPDMAERHPRWVRRVLARFDVLSAPSPYLARWAQGLGLDCQVVANPIDLRSFHHRQLTAARPRLLWLRAFHPIYRPTLAVEVAARAVARHPDLVLTMAGQDKGELAETRRLAERLGVDHAVHFPGFLDPDARAQALLDHDVLLHTNLIDNTPVSLLQAAASGLAIVGAAVGGVADLLADEDEALLAPGGDLDGLVARLDRVLDDPAEAARLSAAGLGVAARVGLEPVIDQWDAQLAALVGRGRPAGTGTGTAARSVV